MRCKIVLSTTVFLVLTILTLSIAPAYAKEVRGVTNDTIKVGVIGPTTGPIATIGLQILEGITNNSRYINEKGGIHGRKIKLFKEDCGYAIPRAIAAYKKLVYKNKIFDLLLGSSTGFMKLTARHCDKDKLPFITSALSESMIPPKSPFHKYVFFGLGCYSDGIRLMFDYIINDLKEENPRIAYVYPDNEMGKAGLDRSRECAKLHGIKLVAEEVLNPGAVEATSQVLKIKRAKADYVIMHLYYGLSACFLRESKKYGYSPKKFFGTSVSCGTPVVRMARKAAKNFVPINYFAEWHMDTPGMKDLREITLGYKPGTETPHRSSYYVQGWVMSMLHEEGLKRAGRDLTPESMVKGLESLKGFSTGGISGSITYSSNDHHGFRYNRFYKTDVEKGLLIPLTDWRKAGTP